MSYNFGVELETGVGRREGELVGGVYGGEIRNNIIIRLVCIDRYNRFKYRRFSEILRWSGNGDRSSEGGGAIVQT